METTASSLRIHVQKLASDIGERNVFRPAALEEAAQYIMEQWTEQGYEVRSQTYMAKGVSCKNLEVTRWGISRNEGMILVGAHYDSVKGSPGADDNASGIAALLEISRSLASSGNDQTIRFVAFVNEEPPFFYWRKMGSMVYARAARQRGDKITLMMSLEMLGYYKKNRGTQRYPPFLRLFYPDRADFIAFASNLRSRRQLHSTTARFHACCDFPLEKIAAPGVVPGISWSDHLSFWRYGYPALMVTDTAFYRNPNYHTSGDTPDTLDYEAFARVTEGLWRTIIALAGKQ